MTQSILLAPTTAAADSEEFVVTTNNPVTVGAFATDSDNPVNGEITSPFRAMLMRKVGTRFTGVARASFDIVTRDMVVHGPGRYRVRKEPSVQAVGFAADDGAE